jgi:hypothetical protein
LADEKSVRGRARSTHGIGAADNRKDRELTAEECAWLRRQ